MICNKCNQDSMEIDCEGTDLIWELKCTICGLTIIIDREMKELLSYNKDLRYAKQLGKDSYIINILFKDNPYSLDSIEIMLNKRWSEGWEEGRLESEQEAFIFSSAKLKEEIEILEIDISKKNILISFIKDWLLLVEQKKWWFGSKYKENIKELMKEIGEFLKSSLEQ